MSSFGYAGKVVLITGASSGIGRALVKEASTAGAKIAAIARSDAALQSAISGMDQAIAIKADVRDRRQVQHAVEQVMDHFGRIDVAISNAGIEYLGPSEAVTADELQAMLNTNFFGFFYLTQAVLPLMRQQSGAIKGRLVHVSSPMARFVFAWSGGYAASKAAADAFALGLRREPANADIRIVTVYPGATATDVGKGLPAERIPPWHGNGPKMEADECARRILKAAANGQSQVSLATSVQMLTIFSRLSPALAERIIQKVGAAPS